MSASLLPRLAEDLGCRLAVATADDFSFDALALRFDLYSAQLRVEGICRSLPGREWLPAEVVVSAGGRPIVFSSAKWTDSLNLARLFAPSHSVWIPLSGQTSGLLSILRPPRHALPQNGLASDMPVASDMPGGRAGDRVLEDAEPAARISRFQPHRGETTPVSQPR